MIDNLVERPGLLGRIVELGRSGDVREVDVTAEDAIGRLITSVRSELPSECLLVFVSREGESRFPDDGFELGHSDTVPLRGQTDAVEDALSLFGTVECPAPRWRLRPGSSPSQIALLPSIARRPIRRKATWTDRVSPLPGRLHEQ